MSPLGEEVSLRKVSGGSEGYGSEEGLQVIWSVNPEIFNNFKSGF